MNAADARKVLHVMTAAWPWAEWPENHIELWLVALQAHDFEPARTAVGRAVRELDRPPSFHWFHDAARAERDKHVVYAPALEAEPVVDGERGAALARDARKALAAARQGEATNTEGDQ